MARYSVELERGGGLLSLGPLEKATVQVDAKGEEQASKRALEKMKQKDWKVRKIQRRSGWF